MDVNNVLWLVFGVCALIGIGLTVHGWRASRRDKPRPYRRRE
jgi:hypothetical protein